MVMARVMVSVMARVMVNVRFEGEDGCVCV